jgi:hypothetical protein
MVKIMQFLLLMLCFIAETLAEWEIGSSGTLAFAICTAELVKLL